MIKSKKHLSRILKLPFIRINEVAENIGQYYYEKKEPKLNKDGTPRLFKGQPIFRTLHPSRGVLKTIIQKNIKRRILSKIELPNNIQGGIKGKDNISNSRFHKGKKYHLVTDILDFFPSISNRQVFKMLKSNGFSNDIAHVLTKLTTYLGKVPQGAPTSTGIANLVFYEVDKLLIDFCTQHNIIYTRFVDDLSFSSENDFRPLVKDILKIITRSGFKINRKKTHYKIGPVDITGINVRNNCLRPTKEFLKRNTNKKHSPASKQGRKRYIKRIILEGKTK